MSAPTTTSLSQERFSKQRFDLVDSLVSKLNRSQDLANEAKDVLLQLEESPCKILQGRKPERVAVAAIRIAGLLSEDQITYRELCKVSNACEGQSLYHFVNKCVEELGLRGEATGNKIRLLRR